MIRTRAFSLLDAGGSARTSIATRARPFAAVVDQIADHFLEILLFAAKLRSLRHVDVDGDLAIAVNFFHGAGQRGDNGRNIDQRGNPAGTRRQSRPLELPRYLVAQDVGLL